MSEGIMQLFPSILGFLLTFLRHYDMADPCVSHSILPRSEYRGGKCDYTQNKDVCDVFLQTNSWFRAEGLNGSLRIQNTPAEFKKCGTKFPWWMNGTHPEVADGEVEREACLADLSSNCSLLQTIKVKNCGMFYVYNLPRTGSCSQAYCFGEKNSCPPFDPCDVYEHTAVTYNTSRSLYCDTNDESLCDKFDSTLWYKFRSRIGWLGLATKCPLSTTCGTQAPHWLTDAVIETSNGTYIGAVCIKERGHCCFRSTTIEYKICADGFTVFRFNREADGQCQTYCTDDSQMRCQTVTTGSVSTSSPIPKESKFEEGNSMNGGNAVFPLWIIGAIFAAIVFGALAGGIVMYAIMIYRMRRVSDSTSLDKYNNSCEKKYLH